MNAKQCTVANTRNAIMKVMQPTSANNRGTVHGGEIMKLVDEAAGASATRLARSLCVTASLDQLSFKHPVHPGNLLILKSQVNCVFSTSMEVGVLIETEDLKEGTIHKVGTAYLTMVALDEQCRPTSVPPLTYESDVDRERKVRAEKRRAYRLKHRKQ